MITVKRLKELLTQLPDDAAVVACEGEGIGLRVYHNGKFDWESKFGWIEAGPDEYVLEEEWRHDLSEFGIAKVEPPPVKST